MGVSLRCLLIPFLAFLCSASLATAATLNESDVGGFSNSINGANGFTQIAGGFDQIDGTLIRRESDFLRFTDLAAGAQTLTFNVNLLSTANNAQASGRLRYWTSEPPGNAFTGGFDLPTFRLNGRRNPSTSQSFSLSNDFVGGDLFVAVLSFSSNQDAYTYSLGVPGNLGGPSQVPLPAAGWLLLAALGGAAWVSRRKNRANAAALAPA